MNRSVDTHLRITRHSGVVYACSYVLVPTSFVIRRSQVAERNDWSGAVVRCVAAHVRRCTRRPSKGVGLGRPIQPAWQNLLRRRRGSETFGSVDRDPNCAEAFVHRSRQPRPGFVRGGIRRGVGRREGTRTSERWTGKEGVSWRTRVRAGEERRLATGEGERAFAKGLASSAPCQWQGTRVRLSWGEPANINLARMRSLQGGPIGNCAREKRVFPLDHAASPKNFSSPRCAS
ncbi:hypothetical protein K0M31_001037 [Melipona bicolor]|uniref:Uncharacterized protein n=1 Tax=Melipona bicolor TaxID=60889 RepID=A0AA40KXT9_9HYME|nr:hypothetical protein K0M31_001037 [Melipona bicolor]